MALSDESSKVIAVAGFPWESEHASHAAALKYAQRCRKHGQRAQLFAERSEPGGTKTRHTFETDDAAQKFSIWQRGENWAWGVIVEGMA